MSEHRMAVKRATRSFVGGIEALAGALSTPEHKVNSQILRNQLLGNERHCLTLERAEEIIDLCDSDELAHSAARQRNGVFIKLPVDGATASDMAVLELMAQVWRANGDVGRAIDETLADGRVEKDEVIKVRAAYYTWQQTMTAMIQRLDGMAE